MRGGLGDGIELGRQGLILVSCRKRLNILILFCRQWGAEMGVGAGELHDQACG